MKIRREFFDKFMVSFDLKSLLTNVPLPFRINLILDRMYPICKTDCRQRPRTRRCNACRQWNDLDILLRVATSDIQFIFNGLSYVQHTGVAMRAPLAPVIADIFMSHLESSLMESLEQKGVCEWYRYVDDTFVLLKPDTKIEDVLNLLNNFHPSIQFTHEPELNGTIAFLDVKVIRSQVEKKTTTDEFTSTSVMVFNTTIHRKETFTGLMTNWNSFVPMTYKKASVVSMIQRAINICSTYTLLAEELDRIRDICHKNDYPKDFVDIRIGIGLSKHLESKPNGQNLPVAGCDKRRLFVEIPYVGQQTDLLKKKINLLTSKNRPDLDVRFIVKPPPSVKTNFRLKDPIPKRLQSDVVYAIKCKDCGECYVGKTERQCERRLREHGAPTNTFEQHSSTTNDHMSNEILTNNKQTTTTTRSRKLQSTSCQQPSQTIRRSSRIRNKQRQMDELTPNEHPIRQLEDEEKNPLTKTNNTSGVLSALAEHRNSTGHQIDWSEVRILWRDSVAYRLLIKESLIIRAHEPILNRTTHSVPLLIFPEGLERDLVPDPNG